VVKLHILDTCDESIFVPSPTVIKNLESGCENLQKLLSD
jgi:hypothetical protein